MKQVAESLFRQGVAACDTTTFPERDDLDAIPII